MMVDNGMSQNNGRQRDAQNDRPSMPLNQLQGTEHQFRTRNTNCRKSNAQNCWMDIGGGEHKVRPYKVINDNACFAVFTGNLHTRF